MWVLLGSVGFCVGSVGFCVGSVGFCWVLCGFCVVRVRVLCGFCVGYVGFCVGSVWVLILRSPLRRKAQTVTRLGGSERPGRGWT